MSTSHSEPSMEPQVLYFQTEDLLRSLPAGERVYHEFLRVQALSAGLYALPARSADPQKPHSEDELYLVLAGRARFRTPETDRAVEPGDIIYVRRGVEHRFHSIEEPLRVLVVFAPAEHTLAPPDPV